MIISVWRGSHLALALSSFLLLTVAALTGIILAAEPVMQQAQGFRVAGADTLTLAQTLPALKQRLKGLQEIAVDENGFVTATFSDTAGNDRTAYIHPLTGAVLGAPQKQSPFFEWVTSLHRSLFLHETGRLIMGVVALLLILIAITGAALIIRRQNGIRRFFAPVERTGFAQYYHTVFGRIFLLLILATAATGTFLSVSRFLLKPEIKALSVDEKKLQEAPQKAIDGFPVFRQTRLEQVRTIQFPFSDFPEDFYTLKLSDRELAVNQFTGEVMAEQRYGNARTLTDFSLRWHTGRSHWIWAILMGITAGYILFFIWSGLAITLKRIRATPKNRVKAGAAETILLVGSENGSTYHFAKAVQAQLQAAGKKPFVTDLNKYTGFPKAKELLIFTSTYGEGDPPSNADQFLKLLQKQPQQGPLSFAVLGFGSRAYRAFCGFAGEVDGALRKQLWAVPMMDLMTVDDGSMQDFGNWLSAYSAKTGLAFSLPEKLVSGHAHPLEEMTVQHRTALADEVFLIQLKAKHSSVIRSGDLLAVYPAGDHRERLYSIGVMDGTLQLSVRRYPHGFGSSFLEALPVGGTVKGRIVKNEHFHFPAKAKRVVMICNGTGIAPFLGMIRENRKGHPIELYCGFRTHTSFELYEAFLQQEINAGRLAQLHIALSREAEMQYVTALLRQNHDRMETHLRDGGVIMICGSLAMQKDVFRLLFGDDGSLIEQYRQKGQLLTDCY